MARARQCDDVGDVFLFGAFHPIVFFVMNFRRLVRKQLLDGGEAGAAMGEGDDVVRIHVVAMGPAAPDAGDGGGGVDEDTVHVNEQGRTVNAGHEAPAK